MAGERSYIVFGEDDDAGENLKDDAVIKGHGY
jgi:hypothetical protein